MPAMDAQTLGAFKKKTIGRFCVAEGRTADDILSDVRPKTAQDALTGLVSLEHSRPTGLAPNLPPPVHCTGRGFSFLALFDKV